MAEAVRRLNLHIETDYTNGSQTRPVETSSAGGTTADASDMITGILDKAASLMNKPENVVPSQEWGATIRKEKFQDMDMLESGHAREYIAEESLSPTQSKSWTYSTVERVNKTQYRMYWNNDQFLMSAKQVGGTFYLSQYEHFADANEDEPTGHYCAVLKKLADNNFKLYNCGCEGCDMSFSTFTCQNVDEDATHATREEGADRQLLADISHFTKAANVAGSEMRCFSVIIPAVMDDRRSRVIWCPRTSREITAIGGTPRTTPKKELVTSPSPRSRQHRFTFDAPTSDRIKIVSKLPVWCPEVNSLMLKFHGGRIREASAKNFMLMVDEESGGASIFGFSESSSDPQNQNRVVMQFGKFSKSKFALDFRYPLAPIQAFAIGLSSCAWNIKVSKTAS